MNQNEKDELYILGPIHIHYIVQEGDFSTVVGIIAVAAAAFGSGGNCYDCNMQAIGAERAVSAATTMKRWRWQRQCWHQWH